MGLIILNFFLISARSSNAVPFGTIFALIMLWFTVSAPLSYIGSIYGLKNQVALIEFVNCI
jgi:transmembrane 9 superfamily protein 2/4